MTAHDQIRAMLDQLMGTSRNGEDEKMSIKFDDPRVCKSFLLGSCPHEILASTRMDLGDCPKVHNLALRADYEIASKDKDYFYDLDAMEQLTIFVAEADRKTEQARKRLAETQEEMSGEVSQKADKIHDLGEKIGEALAKAEQLGAEGLVDESMKLMEEIEALRKEKAEAESDYRSSIPAATYQQQKLRVCDVCCAYLGIHDNDRRLADHFGGKLHLGFIKIRETLIEFQEAAEERRRKRRDQMRLQRLEEEERIRRDREREREKERGDRDRDRRRRSRSKDRGDKKRRRSRSRSRDRKRRSRSRSRDRKKSHKDKKRSRSRDRDKEKKRHSEKKEKEPEPEPTPTLPIGEDVKRNSSISEEESGEI